MSSILAALGFAGLLIPHGFHETAWLHWLPYSSLEFFVVFVPLAILISYARRWMRVEAQWWAVLFAFNLVYLLVFFTHPLQILFYTFYSYSIIRWSRRQPKLLALQMILLLLPMLLKHSTHELQFWGLSYATFRSFHLLMDGKQNEELRLRDYLLFLFYFPSLLAGPIDRWPRFKKAVAEGWTAPLSFCVPLGLQWMVFGFVQKYVLAEALQRWVLPPDIHGLRNAVTGFYGFPLYLYLDFAGYSAMAIGFSLLLGVSLPLNFNKPYLSQNPQDFWRRFHISLGEWLRDYFFKPMYRWLSMNKRLTNYPLFRQNAAIFMTFFLMGLWNGPQKHFLISGALFGLYSAVHNTFIWRAKRRGVQHTSPLWVWASRVLMLHAACLALLIFSANQWSG